MSADTTRFSFMRPWIASKPIERFRHGKPVIPGAVVHEDRSAWNQYSGEEFQALDDEDKVHDQSK